jgi:hypothetical protein
MGVSKLVPNSSLERDALSVKKMGDSSFKAAT